MKPEDDKLEEMAKLFRRAADNIDELLALGKHAELGENLGDKLETAMGKFVLTMMELEHMKE
jgi:hypothetical protein